MQPRTAQCRCAAEASIHVQRHGMRFAFPPVSDAELVVRPSPARLAALTSFQFAVSYVALSHNVQQILHAVLDLSDQDRYNYNQLSTVIIKESNATAVTEVRSASFGLGTQRRHYNAISVVSCTFSVLCVHSKLGHHPHPRGYLCAKFSFFRSLHCWATHGAHTQSLTQNQPLTQLDTTGTEACTSELSKWNYMS